jgi:rhodanese-related sulfurtransferase
LTAALIGPGEIASGEPRPTLIDVREPSEVKAGAVDDALAIPLGQLASRSGEIDRTRPAIAYCGAGERSITAASILEREGVPEVASLDGGYEAWRRHAAGR